MSVESLSKPPLPNPGLQQHPRQVEPHKMTLAEKLYLPLLGGMWVTFRHLVKNIFRPKSRYTVEYPEKRRAYSQRFRGHHILTTRPDGSVRCVACFLCAQACPAECIHIVPTESENPDIERYPDRFDIDLLECVFCGMCVEACPVDAIRMDSGVYSLTAFDRESFLVTKEELMQVKADPTPGGIKY